MAGKWLQKRYPNEPNDDEENPVADGAAYSVKYIKIADKTIKAYTAGRKGSEVEKLVWDFDYCKKKVLEIWRKQGDETEWLRKHHEWAAAQAEKSQMEGQWAADCLKNLLKTHDHMWENKATYPMAAAASCAPSSETNESAAQDGPSDSEATSVPPTKPRLGLFNKERT